MGLFTTLKGHSSLKSVCLTTGCLAGGLQAVRCNASFKISAGSIIRDGMKNQQLAAPNNKYMCFQGVPVVRLLTAK